MIPLNHVMHLCKMLTYIDYIKKPNNLQSQHLSGHLRAQRSCPMRLLHRTTSEPKLSYRTSPPSGTTQKRRGEFA